MFAMTIIVDPGMKSHVFDNGDALMATQPAVLQPTSGLETFNGNDTVITKVFGSSKRNYFSSAVGNLCALASIEGLEIFAGRLRAPAHWRFSPNEEEGAWAHTCGYWLEGPALSTTLDALDELLSWSRKNARELAREDFLGYYLEETDGILKAIKRGERVNAPRLRDVDLDGEGEGPGYLFAYLGTVRHLLSNAIASGYAVLHVAEIGGPDAPADSSAPTPFADRYDAKYWLNEGDLQFEEAEISDGREATKALKDAIKSYSTALGMNPKLAEAYYGWARALSQLARNSSGKKAKEFWSSAIVRFEQALAIESELISNVYDVLTGAGEALDELARLSTGEEAKVHWKAAVVKYEAALKFPAPTVWPDMEVFAVHINCGEALRELAQLSSTDEAKVLREAARVRYDAGLKLLPDEPGLLNYSGIVRLSLAQCSETSDRERLLREAEAKLQDAEKVEPGSASYSLACLNALRGDTAGALTWLKFSASHGTLPTRKHIKGDADFALIRSDPEFVAWLAE